MNGLSGFTDSSFLPAILPYINISAFQPYFPSHLPGIWKQLFKEILKRSLFIWFKLNFTRIIAFSILYHVFFPDDSCIVYTDFSTPVSFRFLASRHRSTNTSTAITSTNRNVYSIYADIFIQCIRCRPLIDYNTLIIAITVTIRLARFLASRHRRSPDSGFPPQSWHWFRYPLPSKYSGY